MDRIGVRIDVTSNFSQLSGDINNANSSLTAFLANSSRIDEFSLAREQARQDRASNTPLILDASGNPYQTENNAAQVPVNPNNIDKPLIDVIRESTDSIVSVLRKLSTPENNTDLQAVTGTGATKSEKSESKEKSLIEKLLVGGSSAYLVRGGINASLDMWRYETGYEVAQTDKQIAAMQGDVYGVRRAELSGEKSLERRETTETGDIIYPIVGAIIGSIFPGIGTVAGGLAGKALGGIYKSAVDTEFDIKQEKEESQIKLAESMSALYKDLLPTYQSSIAAFYNTSGTNAEFFDTKTTELSNIFESGAKNTRLDTATFANLATELTKYGVDNAGEASDLTRQAALYAAYTNGDVGQFNQFAGLQSRYNGEKGINLDYAYGAARASGLDRAQFSEFLEGLESVVSSGISKGFVRSTKDISETMVMFAGLSGGSEFWKGENAAERISKLDEGIAGATGLKSTTDILTYKAFRDAGIAIGEGDKAYIQGGSFEAGVLNTFAAMEGGLNSKNFEAISKTFANAYDGDVMSNVAAWKDLSGLNWRGAMELYNMQQELLSSNGEYDIAELEKRIKKLTESPESSDNARDMQNWQNVLSQLAAEFGQHYYAGELEQIAANTEELKGILNENAEKWAMKDVNVQVEIRDPNDINSYEANPVTNVLETVFPATFGTNREDEDPRPEIAPEPEPIRETVLTNYEEIRKTYEDDVDWWAYTKSPDDENKIEETKEQFWEYLKQALERLNDSNPNNDNISDNEYGMYTNSIRNLLNEAGLVASVNDLKDTMAKIYTKLEEGIYSYG